MARSGTKEQHRLLRWRTRDGRRGPFLQTSKSRKQYRSRRDPLFFYLPAALTVVLTAVLTFEVLRANLASTTPWFPAFHLIGIAPAAALAGTFLALLLTRQQFARSGYPVIGGSGDVSDVSSLISDPSSWIFRLYNGGGGPATFVSIKYWLQLKPQSHGQSETASEKYQASWTDLDEMRKHLRLAGLIERKEFAFNSVSPYSPFVPTAKSYEEPEFAAFSSKALEQIETIGIKVCIEDRVGDRYCRVLSLTPSPQIDLTRPRKRWRTLLSPAATKPR